MQNRKSLGFLTAGFCAGAVNGLFGGGGGMVLVPLLLTLTDLRDEEVFPSSICVILPICLVSLGFTATVGSTPWKTALPYLPGSALGGIAAGLLGSRIPLRWLHPALGALILWGGVRYLCG